MIDYVFISVIDPLDYRHNTYLSCPYTAIDAARWSVWADEITKTVHNYQVAVL